MIIKKVKILSFILIFFSLFISCENLITPRDEKPVQETNTEGENNIKPLYASISGSYQEAGNPDSFESRSAMPQMGSSANQIQYYVIARAENENPVIGNVDVTIRSFFIAGLKINKTWTVELGIKVMNTAADGSIIWVRCFYDISEPVRLTESDFVMRKTLLLKPDSTGRGSVDLSLTVDSSISNLQITLADSQQKAKWDAALAADTAAQIRPEHIKLSNLQSGSYELTLSFYKSGETYPSFTTVQIINVINGLTTDTWVSDGSALISAGVFNLTSTIISDYLASCFYVGNNNTNVTPSDTNEGRAYSPLASVNEAIKRIKNANVSRDYKIFVSKSVAENIKIGGEGADVLPGTAASSITIQGLNKNAADVLMSPYLSTAPCLAIQTDIPVTFTNIKITTSSNTLFGAYNSSAQGGGLYIKTGTDAPGVTLDSGVLIDGCIISGTGARGAGIYLDSGKLTIKNGAKISNNHFPNSSGSGGGIYIKSGAELILSGSFEMPYGGSVTQNDIYVEAADSIKIKNPIIPRAGTSGPMATITPAASFGRGTRIISLYSGSGLSSITPYKNYFAISGSDWFLKASSTDNALVLDSPFYVAGVEGTRQVCTGNGAATGNGTKSAPFATIEQAVNAITALNVRDEYAIYVDGEIIGQQTIPASFTSDKASSLTIQGARGNTSDILSGNRVSGPVLTISSLLPVTIKDLKITGGNNTGNGGGINMISGSTVTLESGALIGGTNESDPTSGSAPANSVTASANYADKGGGIYSEGNLTLKNGSAVIYNYANDGGGICCNGGSLTIEAGAKVNLNGTNTTGGGISITGSEFSMTGGEVCNNISTYGGAGGIYIGGTCPDLMTIDGAEISGNTADEHGDAGGILYDDGEGKTLSITGNTIISGNHCAFEGGGIRIASGVLDLSGGTISNNYSLVTDGRVGGVASIHQSILKLSGSVYIPSGAVINGEFINEPRCNGVRSNHNLIKITGEFIPPSECTDGIIATITPVEYIRGTAIFEAEGNVTDLTPYKDKFALTYEDDGWELKLTPDNTALKLDAPIYVKGTGSSVCTGAAVSDGNGSKSDPFDSIGHALSVMTNKDLDYRIFIDGEVTGSCRLENIKTDGSGTYNAKSILITGAHEIVPGSQRTDIIKQSGFDRVMVINTEVPVTITNLKITGGNTTGYGGGIYQWTNTILTLGDDALIEGNHAGRDGTSDAGGVYVASGATLNIAGNAVVSGNTAGANGTDTHASNVYLDGGVITVTGALVNSKDSTKKANIGVSTSTAPTLTSTILFTTNYIIFNSVAPGTYFTGDQWTVAWGSGTTANEAVLAASGGNITIEPIYQTLTLNVTKSVYLTSDDSKVITFTADNDLIIGSAEGNVSITSCVLTSHGETIPPSSGDKTYYSTGNDTFTFGSDLPTGDYSIDVTASYNGRSYSVSFPVQYKDQLGSKAKTQGKDVGDIVFNDGSTMSYTEYDSLPETIKNELKPKAIAVIFYKGTGLNSGNDTTTVRTLGLGLKQSLKAWCTNSANAYNENITTIQCKKTSGTSGNLLFEDAEANDRNGSNNLEQIAAFLMRNELNPRNDTGVGINSSTTAEAAASLYPAFYFGKNYKNEKIGSETESRIISGSEFETGWYLPTIAELFQIDKNGKYETTRIFDINAVLSALGGESFGNSYLSSSQDCDGAGNANKLMYDGVYNSGKNDGSMQVCCIREF